MLFDIQFKCYDMYRNKYKSNAICFLENINRLKFKYCIIKINIENVGNILKRTQNVDPLKVFCCELRDKAFLEVVTQKASLKTLKLIWRYEAPFVTAI